MPSREQQLVQWALEEGFDRAGVARLEPSRHAAALRSWLEAGHQAGMEWIARREDVRTDPRQLLDGARSALCVALQYHPVDAGDDASGDLWDGVARYARGEDYHLVMEQRLRRLGARIEEAYPGARSRSYVDTGPLLERELAARAGLGAVGKNTNLLHPEAGSWFLIGEVLLTLDLASEATYEDLCGSCTACLEACPTGALPEPYLLDSRLCISYWTIEHRGPIPEPMRRQFDGWVFGCDICQEVCPVNESASPATEPRLRIPDQRRELDLVALLGIDREEYVERFRRSPMKRAKLEGLKRNAVLAMAERGGEQYVEPLLAALETEEDPVVRSHAAWALGELGTAGVPDGLRAALKMELDRVVRGEIETALNRLSESP